MAFGLNGGWRVSGVLVAMAALSASARAEGERPAGKCQLALSKNPVWNMTPTSIEWDRIKTAHFVTALKAASEAFQAQLEVIANQSAAPTFENTVQALEFASERLDQILAVTALYEGSMLTPQFEKKVSPVLGAVAAQRATSVTLSVPLYHRLKTLSGDAALDAQQKRWVDEKLQAMDRSGIGASEADRKEIFEVNERLATLVSKYNSTLLKRKKSIYVIADPSELKGVPEKILESIRKETARYEDEKGQSLHGSYAIPLSSRSTKEEVLKYAASRNLRRRLFYADAQTALAKRMLSPVEFNEADRHDLDGIIRETQEQRQRLARLMGAKNYTDYRLRSRLYKSYEDIQKLHVPLIEGLKKIDGEERATLFEFARARDGIAELQPWDIEYYGNLYRIEALKFDESLFNEHFEVDATLNAALEFIGRKVGVSFVRKPDAKSYHPDVLVYEVRREGGGELLSTIHFDLFERPGQKSEGAWEQVLALQGLYHSTGMTRPVLQVALNILKAGEGSVSTFNPQNLQTFFHEMGHALHETFSDVKLRGLAGPMAVNHDFVEFPSQVVELLYLNPDFLTSAGKNVKTGERIPRTLVDAMKASERFLQPRMMLGYLLVKAELDLRIHNRADAPVEDLVAFENEIHRDFWPFQSAPIRSYLQEFKHIWGGEYDVGYYAYDTSMVIMAAGYEYAESDPALSNERWRRLMTEVFAPGGSEDADALYTRWAGRMYGVEALFRRFGIE